MLQSFEPKELNFFPIDNTKRLRESSTLTQLLQKIETSMLESEEVKQEISMLWLKALDEIREKGARKCKSFLLFEEVTDIGRKLGISFEEIPRLLRYLYEMGVLIWIEESDLREIVILDPIEYFVKPVTRIICKHLASKNDPRAIKHELQIHKECQKQLSEDWNLMLEFGLLTVLLARTLIMNGKHEGMFDHHDSMVVLLMQRYGLMIPVFYQREINIDNDQKDSKIGEEELVYFIPSLLPEDPHLIIPSVNNVEEQKITTRLRQKFNLLSEFSSDMTVSIAVLLPRKTGGNHTGVFSEEEIKKNGFLPNGLFERFIARVLSNLPDFVMKSNDTRFVAFKNVVRIDIDRKLIRFTNCIQQNMIKIEIENTTRPFAFGHYVEEWLKLAKQLTDTECYNSMKAIAVLPVNCGNEKECFVTFDLLRSNYDSKPEYMSDDGQSVLKRTSLRELQLKYTSQQLFDATFKPQKVYFVVHIIHLTHHFLFFLCFPSIELYGLSFSCMG
jgi:hypothetical protein